MTGYVAADTMFAISTPPIESRSGPCARAEKEDLHGDDDDLGGDRGKSVRGPCPCGGMPS
jgi:hypothetical protein